ncbi:MAG: SIMPL domain-containing protein [Holosporaceae bacterium]|jgi:hypothetical protein|nr:SIMPL domain-containing protein [Holosporaceae bacterium]
MKYSHALGSLIVTCGMLVFGYITLKNIRNHTQLVEVRGLSEKFVRADIGNMEIRISNRSANLEELHKKRATDKAKVMAFLKSYNVADEEITTSSDTYETSEEEKTTEAGITTTKCIRHFKAEDQIKLRTADLEKIKKIREAIFNLSSEGILVTYFHSYTLTNFSNIKMQMMKEASENAKKSAEAFVEPFGKKIGKVVYLRQGEITIRGEDESEETEKWSSRESECINKKLRLVVRAGFTKVQ